MGEKATGPDVLSITQADEDRRVLIASGVATIAFEGKKKVEGTTLPDFDDFSDLSGFLQYASGD